MADRASILVSNQKRRDGRPELGENEIDGPRKIGREGGLDSLS